MGFMGKKTAVPLPFHVDRPFLYLITDQATGAVLFIGRVMNPKAG
jgi:serine protease inhibitor